MVNEVHTGRSPPPGHKGIPPYIALAVLVLLSVLAANLYENLLLEKAQLRFEESVADVVRRLTGRLNLEEVLLKGGAGVFAASEDVTRVEWRAYY